jgi:hypothetical protein
VKRSSQAVRIGAGRLALAPRFLVALAGACWLAATGCRENLSTPPSGIGPGALVPEVQMSPARDTTVDSTGVLQVHVQVSDRVRLRLVDFFVIGAGFSVPPTLPSGTTLNVQYPFQLSSAKHSTFRYYVRASNILDHETVSDTVAVTVR